MFFKEIVDNDKIPTTNKLPSQKYPKFRQLMKNIKINTKHTHTAARAHARTHTRTQKQEVTMNSSKRKRSMNNQD
jgi:hypothetical protein